MKEEQAFVRKPYQAADFDAAVERVNQQRCQKCEGHLKFNNVASKPDKTGVTTLVGVCTTDGCCHAHDIVFTIDKMVVREA